mgnify:CR=1 FL=1|jgi:demethylmenaquinone methyltransferase/2-methoxy-6-polyprenyl-1,4-benzoquinol methylase
MAERTEFIRSMFNRIATRYDLINDLLSLGIHRTWLKKAVALAELDNNSSVVDFATGTGKFAFEFAKKNPSISIVGLDFSEKMLEIAQNRSIQHGYQIKFIQADALHTPFPDSTFDVATISYGIRNVNSIEGCLQEMARILKPNGQIIIVEFGTPKRWFQPIYRIYENLFIIPLGGLLSGDYKAYKYLIHSSRVFPSGENFLDILRKTRLFKDEVAIPLSFGIAYIYLAKVRK